MSAKPGAFIPPANFQEVRWKAGLPKKKELWLVQLPTSVRSPSRRLQRARPCGLRPLRVVSDDSGSAVPHQLAFSASLWVVPPRRVRRSHCAPGVQVDPDSLAGVTVKLRGKEGVIGHLTTDDGASWPPPHTLCLESSSIPPTLPARTPGPPRALSYCSRVEIRPGRPASPLLTSSTSSQERRCGCSTTGSSWRTSTTP